MIVVAFTLALWLLMDGRSRGSTWQVVFAKAALIYFGVAFYGSIR